MSEELINTIRNSVRQWRKGNKPQDFELIHQSILILYDCVGKDIPPENHPLDRFLIADVHRDFSADYLRMDSISTILDTVCING